ncbi:MAG: chemotaxis protein CheX [Spirochaetaceae bacterium]|jgi:chemotaxis protein CheX|nr:chemotaxis protein CheX [Spirochaetaceae bacterium]
MEQYIQPFIQVTSTVFKDMLQCEITPDRAYFINKEAFLNWDVSALIALTGEVRGLVAISMKYSTASKITGYLTGTAENVSHSDMTDAIGELVNIIAGNVKLNLEDMFRITISLPKVVHGKAHSIVIPDERTRLLCIPFKIFDNEIICLSINIDETR